MPYTYEEYLHKLKGSKMTENDLKELFDREKLRDEKFHNLIEENEILMGKLKTANKYKYPKCTDCVHAHMDKNGNHDCGFMDCVPEQDKEYPDETTFESYLSCYDCLQKYVSAERELDHANLMRSVSAEIIKSSLKEAKELLKNILAISVHDKRQCTYDAYILTVKEAEQFLEEIKEK